MPNIIEVFSVKKEFLKNTCSMYAMARIWKDAMLNLRELKILSPIKFR
jgi:hypothetical protein